MVTIIEQTHEEKVKMYMKSSKKELISMLIAANQVIDSRPITLDCSKSVTTGSFYSDRMDVTNSKPIYTYTH